MIFGRTVPLNCQKQNKSSDLVVENPNVISEIEHYRTKGNVTSKMFGAEEPTTLKPKIFGGENFGGKTSAEIFSAKF